MSRVFAKLVLASAGSVCSGLSQRCMSSRLRSLAIFEADSDQPENHQDQRQYPEEENHVGSPQESGKQVWPGQEYGTRGDEQGETHSPKMTHQALCAGNAATHQQAHVSYHGKKSHETKDKIRSGRKSIPC